jgi:hypothetical protein
MNVNPRGVFAGNIVIFALSMATNTIQSGGLKIVLFFTCLHTVVPTIDKSIKLSQNKSGAKQFIPDGKDDERFTYSRRRSSRFESGRFFIDEIQ